MDELAAVDRKLRELGRGAFPEVEAARAAGTPRWFPVRGEQLAAGRFDVPDGLDREDLNRRLGKILIDERRAGRPVDGLELLVGFLPTGGRVLSVRSRRPGHAVWVRRFDALGN